MSEIIYILTNPVMPDLVKIGKTVNLEERVRSLSGHTGVPVPFEVYYACTVEDASEVEKGIHDGFGDHRTNPKREFFKINPERVVSILKLVQLQDITPSDDYVESPEEQKSLDKERVKRERFKFSSVGIPVGAILTFARDENVTATVVNDRTVKFEGEDMSLSRAADIALRRMGINWSAVQGANHWNYEGEILVERRIRLEEEEDD